MKVGSSNTHCVGFDTRSTCSAWSQSKSFCTSFQFHTGSTSSCWRQSKSFCPSFQFCFCWESHIELLCSHLQSFLNTEPRQLNDLTIGIDSRLWGGRLSERAAWVIFLSVVLEGNFGMLTQGYSFGLWNNDQVTWFIMFSLFVCCLKHNPMKNVKKLPRIWQRF
jgi:hypothetical protein